MESFLKKSNTVKANEILFFHKAEIDKIKDEKISFASSGSLSLLYFNDYNRYVLQLNDWRYPLLRRLPIIREKDEMDCRTYLLPAPNGFIFRLRIEGASSEALLNLETILLNNSGFSMKGQEPIFKKLEASPDDKLSRGAKKENTSFMNTASETLKHVTERAKTAIGTLKTGTKGLDSRKKMIYLKDIKNKDFKKDARSSFKKDFLTSTEGMSNEFLKMRKENPNLFSLRDFKELAKFTGPSLYIPREDIEEAILNNKDLASKGSFNMGMTMPDQKRTGIMDSVRQGISDLNQGRTNAQERRPASQFAKISGLEGMNHFEG